MENPYEAPKVRDRKTHRSARLLGCLFFGIAAFSAVGVIGDLVVASLTFFDENVKLQTPLWRVATEFGFAIGVAVLAAATGVNFFKGRFKLAGWLAAATLILLVCIFNQLI